MITREFNLNLNAGRSTPLVIFANQFNSDEQWVFTLFDDNGQQYIPSSGSIVGIKADGLGIINSATVTAGKVVVDVTEQITACAGISEFELQLDNGTHGTANFKVVVEKKPSEGAEYSDSDISLIQEALDIVNPLPTGGTAGQVLTKTTNGSSWQDAQAGLPSGGTTGQVLTKTASGSAWQNAEKELPTGGSAGQVLTKTASGTTWSSVDAFPSEGTTGQVLTKATDGVAWTDAGNPTDTQVATAVSDWLDENITPTTPAVDSTLTITGAAADAKKTGDEISALKSQISGMTAIPANVKQAMDNLFAKSAYADDDVASDYAIFHAWASTIDLVSISAVFDQEDNAIYDVDDLETLKQYLTVTATYSDSSTAVITTYTLSGTLTVGSSTVTVSYDGKTTTFTVNVTETPTLKVFKGKGTSGANVIDNANRALTEIIPLNTGDSLRYKWETETTGVVYSAKIATGQNTVSSTASNTTPQASLASIWSNANTSYLLSTSANNNTARKITGSEMGVRFNIKNSSADTTPISATLNGIFYVNSVPYRLTETDVAEFE